MSDLDQNGWHQTTIMLVYNNEDAAINMNYDNHTYKSNHSITITV